MTRIIARALVASLLFLLSGCQSGAGRDSITLVHIHGLGYSADGTQLYVPAHDGLAVLAGGRWTRPEVPKHDYMGFVAVDDGFFSSGHPAAGSNLPNPLGLVKGEASGARLTRLAFVGEIDFHVMGAGYRSHALYVLNPASRPNFPTGVYASLDRGATWQPAQLQGVSGNSIHHIAVHPTDPATVAVTTPDGLFLSRDQGQTFVRVGAPGLITVAHFLPDGSALLYGTRELFRLDLKSDQVQAVPSPALGEKDAISYIAANPATAGDLAIATFGRDLYRTVDDGRNWQTLARNGETK